MRTWLLQAGSNRYFTHNTYSQAVQLLPTCSHPESGHPRVNLTLTGLQKDLSMDMANATRVIWVDEHTQEVAQPSRWLYLTARQPVEAKMLFWVRFVFRALSSHVRGTFYGYGQRDQGYLGRRTHPGGCAGVTVAVSHRSAAC